MPRMRLTRMPEGTSVELNFTTDTEFNIDNGPEGATILALYFNGSQRILHVRETWQQIVDARKAALAE